LIITVGYHIAMSDTVNTHYIKGGFAVVDEIVLSVTSRTRTVFRPGLHGGGVRGHIIRQKIGKDGTWKDVNEVNFSVLPPDCGVHVELDTEATTRLYEKLGQLYEVQRRGVKSGDQKYLVAKEGEALLIDDRNKARAIRGLLHAGYSEEFWSALTASSPDLASRLAASKIQLDRQNVIAAFEASLTTHAADEAYWQTFFEAYPWMLQTAFSAPVFMLCGETYVGGKKAVGRQGVGGVATDFLFSDDSTKSFSVVEIKTPDAKLVGGLYRGVKDQGHDNEVYGMHDDLSGAVVQVRNQIAVAVENFQSVLGPTHEGLNRVHPKGALVAGTTATLSQRRRDSFNHFRHGLHSLSVITFDELLNRLKLLYAPHEAAGVVRTTSATGLTG
jgi:hypothetical protein